MNSDYIHVLCKKIATVLSLRGKCEVSNFQRLQENASIQTVNPYSCGFTGFRFHLFPGYSRLEKKKFWGMLLVMIYLLDSVEKRWLAKTKEFQSPGVMVPSVSFPKRLNWVQAPCKTKIHRMDDESKIKVLSITVHNLMSCCNPLRQLWVRKYNRIGNHEITLFLSFPLQKPLRLWETYLDPGSNGSSRDL